MLLIATQDAFSFGLPMTIIAAVLFVFIFFIILVRRYKRCPSERILVVYGKVGGGESAGHCQGGGEVRSDRRRPPPVR